jgi:succinate dehydrogenase / fumarate reductase, cytochrome b subunit
MVRRGKSADEIGDARRPADMAEATTATQRPLSPHLSIYRPLVNMVMSIMHRMTGAALYAGTALLAWWLVALAIGPKYFEFVNSIFGSIPGKVVLFGYTWALMHHMLGGMRHLIWDTGRGFDLRMVNILSWGTVIGSVSLTAAIWAIALSMRGGF